MKKLNISRKAAEGFREFYTIFAEMVSDMEAMLIRDKFAKVLKKYGMKLENINTSGNYISFTYYADWTERKKNRTTKLQSDLIEVNDEIKSIGFNFDNYTGEMELNDKIIKTRIAFKSKISERQSLLEMLMGKDARTISVRMKNSMDEQTRNVALQVWVKLNELLTLKGGAKEAFNRLFQSIDAGKNYNEAMHRNNIFKAADALGLKLPSGIF